MGIEDINYEPISSVEELRGKHLVYFLQKYGMPDERVLLRNVLLGYQLCYWKADYGETFCFAFDPGNICVALTSEEFNVRYITPRVYFDDDYYYYDM